MPASSAKSSSTRSTKNDADQRLAAYLEEPDSARAEAILNELFSLYAEPMMTRIITARLRRQGSEHLAHLEDVMSDAVVTLLTYMQELRSGEGRMLDSFEGFTSTLAVRTVNDYFRRIWPAFHSLRGKLRYLLENYDELARWKDEDSGDWFSGLAEWKDGKRKPLHSIANLRLNEWEATRPQNLHPADQLISLFHFLGRPMRFNDLANLMAKQWHIEEQRQENIDDNDLLDESVPLDQLISEQQWVSTLWKQICLLDLKQRHALMLNLRGPGGSCGASLLVAMGIATIREIAQALEIDYKNFAEIWTRLPLSDLEIASWMGCDRQHVINLRKSARVRLSRCLSSQPG
jgi:DNA-directed RNA polymerase specialized sigma24 family protein